MNWYKIAQETQKEEVEFSDDLYSYSEPLRDESKWTRFSGGYYLVFDDDPRFDIDGGDSNYGYRLYFNKKEIYRSPDLQDAFDFAQKFVDSEGTIGEDYGNVSLEEQLVNAYGVTGNAGNAGYILTDGNLLDLSHGGYDRDDHRLVGGGTKGMQEFIATGPIRMGLTRSTLFLDIKKKPTHEQLNTIQEIIDEYAIRDGFETIVDIEQGAGDYNNRSGVYDRGETAKHYVFDLMTSATRIRNIISNYYSRHRIASSVSPRQYKIQYESFADAFEQMEGMTLQETGSLAEWEEYKEAVEGWALQDPDFIYTEPEEIAVTIYGKGGWHRYYVKGNGDVYFSAMHAHDKEDIRKAKLLGFQII